MEGLAKIGSWGGGGGDIQDIASGALPAPHRLLSIEVWCGSAADALSFTYAAIDGTKHTVGPWGGSGGKRHKVTLGEAELGTEVSGTFGPWGPHGCIVTSLTFVTSAGKTHGPFGHEHRGGTAFRVPVQDGGRVVGFFARSGWLVDAVGVYVHP